MEKLLIIDDSIPFLNDLEVLMQDRFDIIKATTAKQGLNKLKTEDISAVLLDLKLPDIYGMEVLKKIRKENPLMPVLIITEKNEVETAVEAMKLGAYDYFPKVFSIELLSLKIKKALEHVELHNRVNLLKDTIDSQYGEFVFKSRLMQKIDYEITKLANLDVPVLLLGETGVGKDIIAYQIHKRSKRSNYPFVSISIRSLNEDILESELFGYEKGAFTGATERRIGKFEGANGGTVYLPEISSLSKAMQLKLFEFLQYSWIERVGAGGESSKKFLNVRLITASNENLEKLVKEGVLREDFYYRINVNTLTIPPLRERDEDIEVLANYLLKKHSLQIIGKEYSFADGAVDVLRSVSWKGNVRELENAIIRVVVSAKDNCIEPEDFQDLKRSETMIDKDYRQEDVPLDYRNQELAFKKNYYKNLLQKTNGNIPEAAKIACVSRQALYNIIKEMGI